MADKYEYHKRNDYPGERVAEKKRVADRAEVSDKKSDARVAEKGRTEGLKADARVARKGRMDNELMDSQIERSTARAASVNRSRNAVDTVGIFLIGGLLLILVVGGIWGLMALRQQANEIDSLNRQITTSVNAQMTGNIQLSNTNKAISAVTGQVTALIDMNRPKIISLSVANNEQDVSRNELIKVMFSKEIDPLTVNTKTFTVEQRTTPSSGRYRSRAIEGTVTYAGRTATFKPKELLSPNQEYGNVFTTIITSGVKDLMGYSLAQDYIWSFTTGDDLFNTGATTSQQEQIAPPIGSSTWPKVISVSVANNQQDLSRNEQIKVMFSEDMDPLTVNTKTFTVEQRTTPSSGKYRSKAIEGTVTYAGRIATFKPKGLLSPNQEYGNVFTATITTGVKDLMGYSPAQDYIWSFTTGDDPFNKGATTQQTG